jgi:peptidoglycan biosynthesis protein MviN/MurJ (putative lipid II flippase)
VQARREAGLATANTLSACFNVALLIYALRRKLGRLELAAFRRALLVLIPAAVLAGAIAAGLASVWEDKFGHRTLPIKLGAVFIPGGIASLSYWTIAYFAKVPAAREMLGLVARLRRKVN